MCILKIRQKSLWRSLICIGFLALLLAGTSTAFAEEISAVNISVHRSPPRAIKSKEDLSQWMMYYYLHPQPKLLIPGLLFADQQGLLKDSASAPFTAFVSQVLTQNPSCTKSWTEKLNSLSESGKTLWWTALWWSNTNEAKEELKRIAEKLPAKSQAALLKQIATPAKPIEQMEINSPDVLDMLWGCFCATGDEQYVRRLMSVLPWCAEKKDYMKLLLASTAKWSLTSNAKQHPRVLEICLTLKDTKPELKEALEQVIREAQDTKVEKSEKSEKLK